jgi:hypothetical protein
MSTVDPRTINEYTGDPMSSVVISKPGYDTVRFDPFPFRHQAEGWISKLDFNRYQGGFPEGTTWEMVPYDPDVPHSDPADIPTTMDTLAVALAEPISFGVEAFPDLYLQLQCHLGDDQAAKLWTEACNYVEHLQQPDPEDGP